MLVLGPWTLDGGPDWIIVGCAASDGVRREVLSPAVVAEKEGLGGKNYKKSKPETDVSVPA